MGSSRKMASLTRIYRFTAAHYYYDEKLSQAENERLFGLCANRNGHGHNYKLEVTVQGEVQSETGMLIDLRELDRRVAHEVLRILDHRNLNLEVPWFGEHMPTSENLAIFAWQRLREQFQNLRLARIRVYESEDLYAEYIGE